MAAVALTVIVNVDVMEPFGRGVTDTWLNVVVTPTGAPETERATGWLKPFVDVTVTVELPVLPRIIISEEGEAEIAKSGTAAVATVMEIVTSWTSVPLVPVTVRVYVPTAIEAPTSTVKVEVPVGVTEAGLNMPVAPVGNPEIVRATPELKAFKDVMFIVEVPESP